jgi:hypothetical protein
VEVDEVDAIALRIYRCPVTTKRGRFDPEGASGVHAGVMLVERR